MKSGIITHYQVHNHGAVLQLESLTKVLRSKGVDVNALTFKKSYDFLPEQAENKYNISLKSIPYYLGYLFKNGMNRTFFNYNKRSILEKYKKDKDLIGGFYSTQKELDCIFIGSDEVFSIEVGLTPIFYGMGAPCDKIFSYAASFGPTNIKFIKEKKSEEFVRAGINNIDEISVRDENSKGIVKELTNKEATLVCDPVILYGYQNEKNTFKLPLKEKYLLIYSYDNNMNDEKEVNKIKKFAKDNNFIIVSAGFYHKWCDKNINVSPLELINYVWGAEFIITDTFHGSVLSIIMNKNLAVKIRSNSNKLKFLLSQYNLLNKITENFDDIEEKYKNEIDYKNVNKIIENQRKLSNEFIDLCLESVK